MPPRPFLPFQSQNPRAGNGLSRLCGPRCSAGGGAQDPPAARAWRRGRVDAKPCRVGGTAAALPRRKPSLPAGASIPPVDGSAHQPALRAARAHGADPPFSPISSAISKARSRSTWKQCSPSVCRRSSSPPIHTTRTLVRRTLAMRSRSSGGGWATARPTRSPREAAKSSRTSRKPISGLYRRIYYIIGGRV